MLQYLQYLQIKTVSIIYGVGEIPKESETKKIIGENSKIVVTLSSSAEKNAIAIIKKKNNNLTFPFENLTIYIATYSKKTCRF